VSPATVEGAGRARCGAPAGLRPGPLRVAIALSDDEAALDAASALDAPSLPLLVLPPLTLEPASPASASVVGGARVRIRGAGFRAPGAAGSGGAPAVLCRFGEALVGAEVSAAGGTEVLCAAPPAAAALAGARARGARGALALSVSADGGASWAAVPEGFAYVQTAALIGIESSVVEARAGTPLLLSLAPPEGAEATAEEGADGVAAALAAVPLTCAFLALPAPRADTGVAATPALLATSDLVFRAGGEAACALPAALAASAAEPSPLALVLLPRDLTPAARASAAAAAYAIGEGLSLLLAPPPRVLALAPRAVWEVAPLPAAPVAGEAAGEAAPGAPILLSLGAPIPPSPRLACAIFEAGDAGSASSPSSSALLGLTRAVLADAGAARVACALPRTLRAGRRYAVALTLNGAAFNASVSSTPFSPGAPGAAAFVDVLPAPAILSVTPRRLPGSGGAGAGGAPLPLTIRGSGLDVVPLECALGGGMSAGTPLEIVGPNLARCAPPAGGAPGGARLVVRPAADASASLLAAAALGYADGDAGIPEGAVVPVSVDAAFGPTARLFLASLSPALLAADATASPAAALTLRVGGDADALAAL
jgi:hypothetical protein